MKVLTLDKNKLSVICLLVVFLVAAMTMPVHAKEKLIKTEVRVYDSNDRPIPGVRVVVKTSLVVKEVFTGADGKVKFRFKKTRDEIPTIEISKEGYQGYGKKFKRNEQGNILLTLKKIKPKEKKE